MKRDNGAYKRYMDARNNAKGWRKSIIVPLYKKGEIEECKNYRRNI